MESYMTTAQIGADGSLHLGVPPRWANRRVEVTLHPTPLTPQERADRWDDLCSRIQATPGISEITEEEIQAEIHAYRAGR